MLLLLLINKLLLVSLVISILNVIRHGFFITQIWTSDAKDKGRYELSIRSAFLLGLSIAYIITTIITGVPI